VSGENREGLLNDITQLLAAEHLSLQGASGRVSNSTGQAIITVEAELSDWQQMLQIINLIMLLSGVTDVCRLLLDAAQSE
jgi:(p)ppGpp synthase/HD superfamily hydrolase